MTSSAFAEHYVPEPALDIAINNAAAAHNTLVEPDRLHQLTETARRIQASDQALGNERRLETVFRDTHNDVEVSRAAFSDHYGATAARIDFTPILEGEGDLVVGATSARPEHTTIFTLKLIRGLQNYVLLADAGVIEKPAILFGSTNPQMAILAERFGMLSDIARQNPGHPEAAHDEMRKTPKMEISSSFAELSGRVFSEDTKRLERLLTRRLEAAKQSGETALALVS